MVVVEGYTDVLALHQAGIRETVAIMGTALTAEQMAELAEWHARDRSCWRSTRTARGSEAMLRAARAGAGQGVELRVVEMPEGSDPADLLAAGEGPSVRELLDASIAMIQFQVRRVLADADLDTPAGRDRAWRRRARLIAAVPERTRDAGRAGPLRGGPPRRCPTDYVTAELPRTRARAPRPPVRRRPPAGEVASRAERAFLAMCLAQRRASGRQYLSRPIDDHSPPSLLRRAREHLVAHFDDPLAGLPRTSRRSCALVSDVVHAADERPAPGVGAAT